MQLVVRMPVRQHSRKPKFVFVKESGSSSRRSKMYAVDSRDLTHRAANYVD
jgi:hypothetical protein